MINLKNEEIVFLYEMLKDYCVKMDEDGKEAVRRKDFLSDMSKYSVEEEDKRKEFLDICEEVTSLALTLINDRQKYLFSIMEQLETYYDLILEAEPELIDNIKLLISGEETEQEFKKILKKLPHGDVED